jgi:hypothetical protein
VADDEDAPPPSIVVENKPAHGFRLTDRQERQRDLMGSDAMHIMSFGGSRSGKTFGHCRAIALRAVNFAGSRHLMARFRFNAAKQSLVLDTFPKMMQLCLPDIWPHVHLDKSDWFFALPAGGSENQGPAAHRQWSEVWVGGVDDKDRTEKILGMEFATIFLNECSQIPWASRNLVMTRLAQRVGKLRLKAYYDCNPPGMAHWTYRVFVEKRDPDRRQGLPDPHNYAAIQMNPESNRANLPPDYIASLESMSEAMRKRFLRGEFSDASESQLWSPELLDQQRILDGGVGVVPEMVRVVIAIDPSGAAGDEDERSDEIGIVVLGLGSDGRGYVLEDLSGRMSPEDWGKAAVAAFDRWDADTMVAEVNFGGDMVAAVIRSAAAASDRLVTDHMRPLSVPVSIVRASRSKVVRAEPIATLYQQQKVSHVGRFPELEDQMVGFTTAGYTGSKSPDRADALVWGLTALFPALTKPEDNVLGTRRRSAHATKVNLGHAKAKAKRRR